MAALLLLPFAYWASKRRNQRMAEQEQQRDAVLERVQLDPARYLPQDQSPLFALLPAEVRNVVFSYALEQYEDLSRPYTLSTYYARPDFKAPRRSDTALLRSCQRAYREAWFWPWALAEHVLFLTNDERRPRGCAAASDTIDALARTLRNIHASSPDDMTIAHVHVFPQLYALEPGTLLGSLFALPHFRPLRFTITLRHADWWFWERDEPLRADGEWVARCAFPDSVREFCLELESLDRRAKQIDRIAELMARNWRFKRQDGARLAARAKTPDAAAADGDIKRWQGTSVFNGQRWLEDETAPETLSYYVRTLVFKPVDVPQPGEARGRLPALDEEVQYGFRSLHVGVGHEFGQQFGVRRYEEVADLRAAGVEPGTPAVETRRRMMEWRQAQMFSRRRGPARPSRPQ